MFTQFAFVGTLCGRVCAKEGWYEVEFLVEQEKKGDDVPGLRSGSICSFCPTEAGCIGGMVQTSDRRKCTQLLIFERTERK